MSSAHPGDLAHQLRQIWMGNLHPETTAEDVCNVVRGGMLINVKLMLDKHCAFVTFVDVTQAANFFQQASYQGIMIRGRRIKLGWAKPVFLSERIIDSLRKGATRNIYLGGIDPSFTEQKLRTDFSEFGEIEQVHIIKEKNTGFVNFTSLLNAVSAYERIQKNPSYSGYAIRFGKDRCSNPFRANSSRNAGNNPMPYPNMGFDSMMDQQQQQMMMMNNQPMEMPHHHLQHPAGMGVPQQPSHFQIL